MKSYKEAPWQHPVEETVRYLVYRDKYPVTDGHTLIVPKDRSSNSLIACFQRAYELGESLIEDKICTGYNIGQNVGENAGQTVMWPHVHLIPRTEGDLGRYENGAPYDPTGGVRNVIPEKGNYKK